MRNIVLVLLVLSGIVFVASVMLMSPKWGLWFGIWWASNQHEYGSKKSLEWKLKTVAFAAAWVFLLCVLFLPYL